MQDAAAGDARRDVRDPSSRIEVEVGGCGTGLCRVYAERSAGGGGKEGRGLKFVRDVAAGGRLT